MSAQPIRTLLIYPPSRTQSHYACPLGMQMLAAVLEKSGCEVRLLDANALRRKMTTPDIVRIAAEQRPDAIGITLLTPLAKEAYRLASALRATGAKLLAGGPHATLLPEEPLAHGFDAAVVGEGEPTIVEAVRALRGEIPMDSVQGLVYRAPDGAVRHNPPRPPVADLDALPPPARHLVDPADFGPPDNPGLHNTIFTSRGCPARCAYCAGGLFGKKFRFRSADGVVDEMLDLHRRYRTRHFCFVDDAMSMDRPRMRQICNRLIEERLGLTWNMMTRVDAVDEEMLRMAAAAGCVRIDYGVESGHPETLKKIHKPHTADMVRRVVPLTARCGIQPVAFFILGFPWENAAAIDVTRQLMEDIAPHVIFEPAIASILIPFPGTEIYERFCGQYGFADWWLGDDRNYDAPRADRHPFYQVFMYRTGAVLDADFFRYSPEVKAKIYQIFRLMFASNLRRKNPAKRLLLPALDLSRKLNALWPPLERAVFKLPLLVRQSLHKAKGIAN
jgi:anaerobic magnesium-protoporphyrin IX monomethyl ester cyclase